MNTVNELTLALLTGLAAGKSTIYVFNRIPAKWLCEYGEKPSREMWGERVRRKPWEALLMMVFAAVCVYLMAYGPRYFLAGVLSLWILLQIAMADKKYMIIPDQYVVALAVCGIGFLPFHPLFPDVLLGAILGGGSFFLVGLAGKLFFKKDTVGFGDVKLLFSVGILAGIRGMAIILIFTVFLSALVLGIGLLRHRFTKDAEQPLGPFIAFSTAMYILFFEQLEFLLDWYLGAL